MVKQLLPWGLLGIAVFFLIFIGIKSCNNQPPLQPHIHAFKIAELKRELYAKQLKADSLQKEIKELERLYAEESKKTKRTIIRTNEKIDSIRHLPLDSAQQYFQQWTKLAVPGIPE